MEIKRLITKEGLDDLGSALTMVGITEGSIQDYIEWIKQYTPMKSEMAYIVNGKTMNEVYHLTGSNAYPDDLTIVSIKLEDMEDLIKIVTKRFEVGARWFDDIVENNALNQE